MKIVHKMDPMHFDSICEMGADLVVGATNELDARGIDSGHVGNVFMVAMAGLIANGDVTVDQVIEGIESCKKMWVRDPDNAGGFILKTPDRSQIEPAVQN